MSRRHQRLPVHVDPFRLAREGQQLDTAVSLAQTERLAELLCSTDSEVVVSLEFGVDAMGVSFLKGRLQTELGLTCQRCLECMELAVDTEFALGFVRNMEEADAFLGDYEPFVVETERVDLLSIIEDELLLALPQIPMHPLTRCPAKDRYSTDTETTEQRQDEQTVRKNPFSVLADLKTKGK